jgi:bifunctional non-homologous end joining protein LigD
MITRTFESSSSAATYTAQFDHATQRASCTCPGFRFPKAGGVRTCKHVRQLASEGGAAPAIRAAAPAPAAAPSADMTVPKPMLASAMTKTTFEACCNPRWVLEEKFDGHRVTIRKRGASVIAWSRPRSGQKDGPCKADLPAHILDAVALLPDGVYDGEKFTPGGRSWDVANLEKRHAMVLVIFDVLEVMGESVMRETYAKRREYLKLAVDHAAETGVIVYPETQPVSDDAVQAIWSRGGEGAILKDIHAPYQPGKRSDSWLKVKRSGAATVTIIGYEAGKMGPHSKVILRTDDGRETSVKTSTNADRAAMAANPASFIGKRLVIAYTEFTDDGKFRHGVWDHLAGAGE